MVAKTAEHLEEKVEVQEEILLKSAPAGTVAAAAEIAAEAYAPTEVDQHAQTIIATLTERVKMQTNLYVKRATQLAKGEGLELAEPVTPTAFPYPWWNILMWGPFQPAPLPGGPYLPHKIFRAAEPAFMIGAVWLNPAPINWFPPGPSAATVMSAFDLTIRAETINLTNVSNGPDPAPVVMSPLGAWPGLPWFKPFVVSLGSGFFSAPPQGQPHLYELNVTADVSGPVGGLPFAGYSTWLFDPDAEPPIFPPFILGGVPPMLQYDIPARFLVYTA